MTDLQHHEVALDLFKQAIALLDSAEFEQALDKTNQAISYHPNEGSFHILRGKIHSNLGQWEEALKDFAIAVRLSPEDGESHFNYALIHHILGNNESALNSFILANQFGHPAANEMAGFVCLLLAGKAQQENSPVEANRHLARSRLYNPNAYLMLEGDVVTPILSLLCDNNDAQTISQLLDARYESKDPILKSLNVSQISQILTSYLANLKSNLAEWETTKSYIEKLAKITQETALDFNDLRAHLIEEINQSIEFKKAFYKSAASILFAELGQLDSARSLYEELCTALPRQWLKKWRFAPKAIQQELLAEIDNVCPSDTPLANGKRIDPRNINQIAIVCYYGRSGTSLLTSLLDSHSHVLFVNSEFRDFFTTFPADANMNALELLWWFLQTYDTSSTREEDWLTMPGAKTQYQPVVRDFPLRTDETNPHWAHKRHFIDIFIDQVEQFYGPCKKTSLSAKEFFLIINTAYAEARGRTNLDDTPIVLWHQHFGQPAGAQAVVKLFDTIKYMHMVRHPIQTLGSHYNRYFNQGDMAGIKIVPHILFQLFMNDKSMLPADKGQACAIRLEDLHLRPVQTTHAIADFLEIPWNETLMESTVSGKEMVWKTKGKNPFSGFNPDNVREQHLKTIPVRERLLLINLLKKCFIAWKYQLPWYARIDCPDWILRLLCWLPLHMEIAGWKHDGINPFLHFKELLEARKETRNILLKRIADNREPTEEKIVPLLEVEDAPEELILSGPS